MNLGYSQDIIAQVCYCFICFRTWRKREEEFNDYQFNPSARESEKYKETGNDLFKQEKYMDAISRYTHAIEVVPFASPSKKPETW